MSAQTLIEALLRHESTQRENLISLLGALKGSKTSDSNSRLPSMVRGLCTSNLKLLTLANQCLTDMCTDDANEFFKSFTNDLIMWFDKNLVVFEKYLDCVTAESLIDGPLYQRPLLHCQNYCDFLEGATTILRNPFVLDKLQEAGTRTESLLERNTASLRDARLKNISFDNVQAFNGLNVSCFFTPKDVVKRTDDADLFMDFRRIEMLLTNLGLNKSLCDYDSLVILEIPIVSSQPRSVIFPPFRVNELLMVRKEGTIEFTSLGFQGDVEQAHFTISGLDNLLDTWYNDLRSIFPIDEKFLSSRNIHLQALGINTLLESSDESSPSLSSVFQDEKSSDKDLRKSFESSRSIEIMKKTLSSNGISSEEKDRSLQVIQASQPHHSITAEYSCVEDSDDEVSCASIDCFDMIGKTSKPAVAPNPLASVSLPNLVASERPDNIYNNAAGSAVDVNNFGKNYNPTFSQQAPLASSAPRKKSFLDLFKKKKKQSANVEESEHSSLAKLTPEKTESDFASNGKQKSKKSAKIAPELKIEIPKIGALDASSSQPGSAVSNRTLPLPFALPSSTSMYFFKPYVHSNGSGAGVNDSAVSLAGTELKSPSLEIPQDFKDVINSDDTLDFYISPTEAKSIKVSRWKERYGKWELLTTNENVFLKIVANYNLFKSWLLVFKEEYDNELDEIIDVPLLVLNLDGSTNVRQSTALDIEINAVNSFTQAKCMNIIRCSSGALVQAILSNLTNILEVMNTKKTSRRSSVFESNMTLSSSLLSKPSASSTLTSIFTHLEQSPSTPSAAYSKGDELGGEKLLLDRMTVKVHKQMESYDHIHQLSSWKSLAMYSLSILHSIDAQKSGFYVLDMQSQAETDEENEALLWSFEDDLINEKVERIGKAALLVRVSADEIYMLECKGKKEFRRLIDLF